jgi:hydrogenase-1 operon protein HyaF
LRSLPITSADRSQLETRLGRGDVEVALCAGGASEIWETRYSGVWWVRHFGCDDKLAAERIEITAIPEIVVAQGADIAAALARLSNDLACEPFGAVAEHAEHV